MRSFLTLSVLAVVFAAPAGADIRPDQAAFRDLYKELVETNTTLSVGSCTLAAERMAARLKSAGFNDSDMRVFGVPDHPNGSWIPTAMVCMGSTSASWWQGCTRSGIICSI